jgi:hypothetical protein
MGLWSKFKNAVKKAWRAVKAAVRVVVRAVITVVNAFTLGLYDLLLGFLAWPPKRLRLHVIILAPDGPTTGGGDDVGTSTQVVATQVVQDAIDRTKRIYKERFNVNVRPYSETFIQILEGPVPPEVLDFECGIGSEFGVAGEFLAQNTAGWNAIPISFTFPVTVFVVRSLKAQSLGCSMAVIAEYVVIAEPGLMDNVGLAHEIGHTCSLWHSGSSDNLMYWQAPAGEKVKWFQKNLVRSSRHVQYW